MAVSSKLTSDQIYQLAIKAGFAPDAAQTMTGIVLAESGGDPNAVGDKNNPGPGASSVGLAQINFLPSRDTGNANRDPKGNLDPLTNLKNAYKISNGGTNFAPWTTYTQGSYKQFMPTAPKSIVKSPVPKGTTPPLSQSAFTAKYGAYAAAVYNEPGLAKLFSDSATGGLPPDEFTREFLNSDFYKKYGARYSLMESDKYSDPQKYAQALSATTAHVKAAAAGRGIQLSDAQLADASAWTMGQNYGTGTIDDTQLIPHLTSIGTINTNAVTLDSKGAATQGGGTAYQIAQQLRGYSNDMGIGLNDKVGDTNNFYDNAAKNVLNGKSTPETYQDYIKQQAVQKYSGFANQINNGMTVRDIASPYLSSMSKLLEIPSDSISFSDPTNANYSLINKALGVGIDPTTGTTQPMPGWQFDQAVRNDPRWTKTQNAQDTVESMSHQVIKDFGLGN